MLVYFIYLINIIFLRIAIFFKGGFYQENKTFKFFLEWKHSNKNIKLKLLKQL